MAYTFADSPEIGFAFPFLNMSFERWDATLADQWTQEYTPGAGTRSKYNPGFDSTRAMKIADTGIVLSPQNGIYQSIALPSYILNGQKTRAGAAILNSINGYGNARAVMALTQNNTSYYLVNWAYPAVSANWQLYRVDSTQDLSTSYTDLRFTFRCYSWDAGVSNPAMLIDCVFAEYGRSITERYYTFPRKPSFNGVDVRPMTFVQDDRTGVGKRRTWDPTGGAIKWKIVMPFENIPGAMYEALFEFFRRNKGGDDKEGVHLVLHHKLVDTTDAYNLHMPPWIICDIVDKEWPLRYSGAFAGAKLFSGTITFEEV